ncbi:MAG: hypothetical protein AAB459_01630 [Patescibacteria group bacterium]
MFRGAKKHTSVGLALLSALAPLFFIRALAQPDNGEFSLQISPSPLVVSVRPGEQKNLDLQIKNNATTTESLKMELRKFKISESGEVQLTDDIPADVSSWVGFEHPTFEIQAGKVFTQKVMISTPGDVGFSYSFIITVSRQQEPQAANLDGNRIKGTVAVFTLVSIDKPGATRKIEVIEFSSQKRVYEYLPADFQVKIKNTGNSIVQPFGNIYIQRSSNSSEPISLLTLNEPGGYILPNTNRTLNVGWSDGFPVYQKHKPADNVPETNVLKWDWSKVQNFRFGKYTAILVAVYNDGQRDIPLESEVSFWILPWKLLTTFVLIFLVLVVGATTILKRSLKPIKLRRTKSKNNENDTKLTD